MPSSSTGTTSAEVVIFDYYMLIVARLSATSVLPEDATIEYDVDDFVQDLLDLQEHPDDILVGRKKDEWEVEKAAAASLRSDQERVAEASLLMSNLAAYLGHLGRYQEGSQACDLATELKRLAIYQISDAVIVEERPSDSDEEMEDV